LVDHRRSLAAGFVSLPEAHYTRECPLRHDAKRQKPDLVCAHKKTGQLIESPGEIVTLRV